MKINNLKINEYGNIKEKNIDLKQGINIVYGANESGKSTLLNYIISSFYGISKNKEGKDLPDYEKYKPWDSNEFSGRIHYKLDNGEKFEIFRDFNKKNPKIYNEKLEDITKQFEIDKRDGSKFFFEQTGVDKQMYLSTVVSMQEEIRLDEKNQNILIQKIANLAGTGEDNVSYKKALTKLQDKIRDEIGTNKTTQKPINILEKEIKQLEEKINEIIPYQNRKYEIDTEKESIEEELKILELKKKILVELQNAINNKDIQNKEIEIKEKNKNENLSKIIELKNQEANIIKDEENIKNKIEENKNEILEKEKKEEEIKIKLEEINNKNIEKENTEGKNKNVIFLVSTVFFVLGIILTITLKNYLFIGAFGALVLINIFIYTNVKNRKNKDNIIKNRTIKEETDFKISRLEEENSKLQIDIEKIGKELKKYEEIQQEINNKISMTRGQMILLEKNNEQITKELNDIQENLNNRDYNKRNEIIAKYQEKFNNIEELLQMEDYKTEQINLEEKINNAKIKIKGLEIESNTIMPQLDGMVALEEKLELNNERLEELRKQEETINIAIDNLSIAYEEMKNTITPKFTTRLSASIDKISKNKYQKVTINDQNGMIIENNRGEYVEASKLSTGTIDQLYLALRLSMIDDLSKEKLPIILDESFAYFDNNRLENVFKYLKEELENHQVIIFTCTNREKEILDKIKIEYNLIEL